MKRQSTRANRDNKQPAIPPQASRDDHQLLLRAVATLEAILEEGLTFTTEQEADSLVRAIKARVS